MPAAQRLGTHTCSHPGVANSSWGWATGAAAGAQPPAAKHFRWLCQATARPARPDWLESSKQLDSRSAGPAQRKPSRQGWWASGRGAGVCRDAALGSHCRVETHHTTQSHTPPQLHAFSSRCQFTRCTAHPVTHIQALPHGTATRVPANSTAAAAEQMASMQRQRHQLTKRRCELCGCLVMGGDAQWRVHTAGGCFWPRQPPLPAQQTAPRQPGSSLLRLRWTET